MFAQEIIALTRRELLERVILTLKPTTLLGLILISKDELLC